MFKWRPYLRPLQLLARLYKYEILEQVESKTQPGYLFSIRKRMPTPAAQ
jgi:hypothetical protein